MADFKGRKSGKSHNQNMGIFILVAQDMVLSHRAKFQLIINFFRVKAISTELHVIPLNRAWLETCMDSHSHVAPFTKEELHCLCFC